MRHRRSCEYLFIVYFPKVTTIIYLIVITKALNPKTLNPKTLNPTTSFEPYELGPRLSPIPFKGLHGGERIGSGKLS